MDFEPKVSIVIPTYKREVKYLKRAVDSVLNQTYQNIQVVIVDDNLAGSNYRKNVQKYMEDLGENKKIRFVQNTKNLGGALARNEGIRNSEGAFITFLDDDDKYLPNKIEKQLKFMLKANCDLSFTDLLLVNELEEVVDYREFSYLEKFDKEYLLKAHIMNHLTGTPTFMFKADQLMKIGGFEDAIMGQEFFLMLKAIENNLTIKYIPECNVIAYRHNSGGISQGPGKIKGEMILYNFKKKYFKLFTNKEKKFINFRHYAVLTVVHIRNTEYLKALVSGIRMIISSPYDSIKEGIKFFRKDRTLKEKSLKNIIVD